MIVSIRRPLSLPNIWIMFSADGRTLTPINLINLINLLRVIVCRRKRESLASAKLGELMTQPGGCACLFTPPVLLLVGVGAAAALL